MYSRLDIYSVAAYIKDNTNIFTKEEKVTGTEISDGNLNLVFRVESQESGKSAIVKQSLPTLRIDETMKLCLERIDIEYKYLIYLKELQSEYIPTVYHYDEDMKLIIMEDLKGYKVLRNALLENNFIIDLGKKVGSFLVKALFCTSDLYLDQLKKKDLVKDFINPELCKITEDLVFTQPYYNCEKNKIDRWLLPKVEEIIADKKLKVEVAKLRNNFMNNSQALLHGDLHTGSIMVNDDVKIIDGEFSFFGPMGFDIGAFMANILLNYLSQEAHIECDEERKEANKYLKKVIYDTWTTFESEFEVLWKEYVKCPVEIIDEYRESYINNIFRDALGYSGCKIIRRIYGLAHVTDIDSIEDISKKERVQIKALELGRYLIINREKIGSIEALIDGIDEVENTLECKGVLNYV